MRLLLIDRPKDIEIIKNRDIEYFGPWAQAINTPEDLSKPTFEPYPTAKSVYNASLKAINIAKDILDSLANILPDLTGVNKNKRFWRVLLGHNVIALTGIVEDIKIRHSSLLEKNYILGLPSNDYPQDYIPYSWKDVGEYLLYSSFFRRYVISLYLKDYYINHEFLEYAKIPHRKISRRIDELYTMAFQENCRALIKKVKSCLFHHFSPWNKVKGLYDNTSSLIYDFYNIDYLDYKKWDVALLHGNYLNRIKLPFLFQTDNEKRKLLRNFLPHPYGDLLSKILPIITLEGLPLAVRLIEKKINSRFKSIKSIYTHGQAFSTDWSKRTLLAMLADEGKIIVSIQHGGEPIYFANSAMFMDRIIADEYISWGTGYSNFSDAFNVNNTRVLPSIYLNSLKRKSSVSNKKKKWDVLFVVLEEDRYIKWLYSPLFPDMAYDYFKRQKALFDYFCVGRRTAIKVYKITYGWGQSNWIKSKYPSAKLLVTGRFVDYALKSRVVIIDYNSTSFLEMLATERPFLATWNRRWFKGEKLFETFIDKLIDVGVFYEQPEALIESYNEDISPDVELWWRETKRQEVVREMANNFAMTSNVLYEKWSEELKRPDC